MRYIPCSLFVSNHLTDSATPLFGQTPVIGKEMWVQHQNHTPLMGQDPKSHLLLYNTNIALNLHINVVCRFANNKHLYEATGFGTLLIASC